MRVRMRVERDARDRGLQYLRTGIRVSYRSHVRVRRRGHTMLPFISPLCVAVFLLLHPCPSYPSHPSRPSYPQPFKQFCKVRDDWADGDYYRNPGPIQFAGRYGYGLQHSMVLLTATLNGIVLPGRSRCASPASISLLVHGMSREVSPQSTPLPMLHAGPGCDDITYTLKYEISGAAEEDSVPKAKKRKTK